MKRCAPFRLVLVLFGNGSFRPWDASALSLSFFLSIDTESINFDHHIRCGGFVRVSFRPESFRLGLFRSWVVSANLSGSIRLIFQP